MIYDVSDNQRGLNLLDLPNVDGVIIRVGFGDNYENQDDTTAEDFVRQCKDNAIPFGYYIFSYATDNGNFNAHVNSEIEHMLRRINELGSPELGVWLDIENDTPYKREKCGWEDSEHVDELNAYITEWLHVFDDGGVYCDRSHNSYLDIPVDRLWLATLDGTLIEDCVYCQFSSDPINGTAIDQNIKGKYELASASSEPAGESNNDDNSDSEEVSYSTYTVESGDTLWGIAEHFYGDGNKYTDIAEFNHIDNSNYIYPGDVLMIPTDIPSSTSTDACYETADNDIQIGMKVHFTGDKDIYGNYLAYKDRIYDVAGIDGDNVHLMIYGDTYAVVDIHDVEPV